MARPKLQIDPADVEALAAVHCTVAEIAAELDCSKRTLETRFCAAIEKGRERAKTSLKRAQFRVALDGNPAMLIWLGKQYLGQADRSEMKVDLSKASDAELRAIAES
jgi:hypothetical protein